MRATGTGDPPQQLSPRAALLLVGVAALARTHALLEPDGMVLGWRQADMLSVARNYFRNDFHLFYPQIDWSGAGPGFLEMELPIVSFLTAFLWRVFGPHELLAGVIPVACGLGTVVVLARLATRLAGPAAGFAAGLFAAASPLFAWYGATFQEEAPMLFASVLAVSAMEHWLETDAPRDLVLAGLFTSLAVLVKATALLIGLPLLYVFWEKWRWSLLRRPAFWIFGALVLVPPVLWYAHAHGLYVKWGNTVGVLSGGYDKFARRDVLLSSKFWVRIPVRIFVYVLTPLGAFCFLAGVRRRTRGPAPFLLHAWLSAFLVYVFVVARGNQEMDYYQLPLLPAAAAFAGVGLAGAVGGLNSWRARGTLVLLLIVNFVLARHVYLLRAAREIVRDGRVNRAAGHAVARVTEPGSLLIVTTGYGGSRRPDEIDTPPEIFYHADRRGWFVSLPWLTPEAVSLRRRQGARYLVVPGEDLADFHSSGSAGTLLARYPRRVEASDLLILDLSVDRTLTEGATLPTMPP